MKGAVSMSNLLSANFARMWKSRVFWGCLSFMAFGGAFFAPMGWIDASFRGSPNPIDLNAFECALFILIAAAVFCSLFVGVEYSNGRMRSKIATGHSRAAVYLSLLIVCGATSLLFCAAWFVTYLGLGLPLRGPFEMGWSAAVLRMAGICALSLAAVALFLLFAMLCQSRTVVAILSILLSIGLFMGGGVNESWLNQPATFGRFEPNASGESILLDAPNPLYLDEPVRTAAELLLEVNPGGQAFLYVSGRLDRPQRLTARALGEVVALTVVGLALFRRKDLK